MAIRSEQMLSDITASLEIFDAICDDAAKLPFVEQKIMKMALYEAARHVARFCAAVEQLNNDGLVAALGMLDVELRTIGDDESSEFQQEELN